MSNQPQTKTSTSTGKEMREKIEEWRNYYYNMNSADLITCEKILRDKARDEEIKSGKVGASESYEKWMVCEHEARRRKCL